MEQTDEIDQEPEEYAGETTQIILIKRPGSFVFPPETIKRSANYRINMKFQSKNSVKHLDLCKLAIRVLLSIALRQQRKIDS